MQFCKDHTDHKSKIDRNKCDIQTIFDIINKLFWRMAILTGTLMGVFQGVTIVIILLKVKG